MPYEIDAIAAWCQKSPVGKLLPQALYVHQSLLNSLPPWLQAYEKQARQATSATTEATLVKFSTDKPRISYLFYPDFDQNPHPQLAYSLVVNVNTLEVQTWDYRQSNNPPILHRKETFVGPNYPRYQEFAALTQAEIALGLLEKSHLIGTREQWRQRLLAHHLDFQDHRLICPLQAQSNGKLSIERYKAAIIRHNLSRPVSLALEAGLFTPETSFFDYGCGHGEDIAKIAALGYPSQGWDPYYRSQTSLVASDIVNIGYVINVIEDLQERRKALEEAWKITQRVLIVAAQVLLHQGESNWLAYGDGVVTSRHTFQKYYQQEELKSYIDQVLQVDAIPVGLGIYFVFRDATAAEIFRASRFHRTLGTPRLRLNTKSYADYQEILTPLQDFVLHRGRLPVKGELDNEDQIKSALGSIRRGFQLILQVTEFQEWEAIAEQRRQDLLLYLALSHFRTRPRWSQLSPVIRQDIKSLLGSYKQACLLADMMLVTVSDLENLADIAQDSSVGYQSRSYFLVHLTALDSLDAMLRLYEGCASRNFGRLEAANLVQFSWRKPQITYLCCPDFAKLPHPPITSTMTVSLDTLQISYRDYQDDYNPPVIHRKDRLVSPSYPHQQKFARLTRQEEDWGLLENLAGISRLQTWLDCLTTKGATLQGHRLTWRSDLDPHRLKYLKAQVQKRKRQRNSQLPMP